MEAEPDAVFEVLASERLHDGFVKLDLYAIRQRRFAGEMSPVLRREVVVARAAVAVICYDPVRDCVVLVEQFRLPAAIAGMAPIQTEIVAGLVEIGETPEDVARREVREETGLDILGTPLPIARMITTPGHSTETVQIFCARVDSSLARDFAGSAAENEDIRVLTLPFEEFEERLRNGRIHNGFSLVSGLWLQVNRERVRRGWEEEI